MTPRFEAQPPGTPSYLVWAPVENAYDEAESMQVVARIVYLSDALILAEGIAKDRECCIVSTWGRQHWIFPESAAQRGHIVSTPRP